jgi:hypothetical protein
MDLRIAIDLGCRCLKDPGSGSACKIEHVDRSIDAGPGRLDRNALIVDGRGRAGEIEDLIRFDFERHGNVVPEKLEIWIAQKVTDVFFRAGGKIVGAYYLPFLGHQQVA